MATMVDFDQLGVSDFTNKLSSFDWLTGKALESIRWRVLHERTLSSHFK